MSDKLLELYVKNYLKGSLDFYGINLIPSLDYVDGELFFHWGIDNPNDLPYSIYAMRNFMYDSFDSFCELTGHSDVSIKTNIFKEKIFKGFRQNINSYYISQTVENKMIGVLNKKFKVDFHSISFKYKINDITNIHVYGEDITLELEIEIVEAYDLKSGEDIHVGDMEVIFDKLYQSGDYYDLFYEFSWPIRQILASYETFYDENSSYFNDSLKIWYKNKVL